MSVPTLTRAGRYVYGDWSGNPKGCVENLSQCIEEVWGTPWVPYQCKRKRGHGANGLFCRQHAKKYEKEPT